MAEPMDAAWSVLKSNPHTQAYAYTGLNQRVHPDVPFQARHTNMGTVDPNAMLMGINRRHGAYMEGLHPSAAQDARKLGRVILQNRMDDKYDGRGFHSRNPGVNLESLYDIDDGQIRPATEAGGPFNMSTIERMPRYQKHSEHMQQAESVFGDGEGTIDYDITGGAPKNPPEFDTTNLGMPPNDPAFIQQLIAQNKQETNKRAQERKDRD